MKLYNATRQLLLAGSEGRIDLVFIEVNQVLLHRMLSGLSALDECIFDLSLVADKDEDDPEAQLNDSDFQFSQIHEDADLDDTDKFRYMIQDTVPGSKAREIIESFPLMGKKNLHGCRLLILTIQSMPDHCRLRFLYDQLETKLRALETLGVTSDQNAAILFPLVKSYLTEDFLVPDNIVQLDIKVKIN
ncbi:hypothetical protein PR048_011853 [Dryococelus australis]|uniref:Uncharacterized protein n=1 Tax=Dryococelus australis TaxID=614101 RepID=A0ABQ9HN94_9NEOP|nr:hypothetical protein PR048_011853 [Dryococelus australis]